jgi:hypothetical protein
MTNWCIRNGIPYDVAHALDDGELLAHTIVFAQFENNGLEWDWDRMRFIEKK